MRSDGQPILTSSAAVLASAGRLVLFHNFRKNSMFPPGTLRHRVSVTLCLLLALASLWWPVRESQTALRGVQLTEDNQPVVDNERPTVDAVVYHDPHIATRISHSAELAELTSRTLRLAAPGSFKLNTQLSICCPGASSSIPGDRSLVVHALSPIALHVLLRV